MTTPSPRTREPYATDLTEAQWQVLQPLLPLPAPTGRPRTGDLREILNAHFYLVRTGCQWRLLPKGFPGWTTVRYYFDKWTRDGTWQRLNDALRVLLRQQEGRQDSPSAAILAITRPFTSSSPCAIRASCPVRASRHPPRRP